jgi:diketogulonate reductase-like aldo/keto reductase
MTLIDTAELYGSEEFIGRVIARQRNRVFLVSKVWPNHVAGNGIVRAGEASLARLGTDRRWRGRECGHHMGYRAAPFGPR